MLQAFKLELLLVPCYSSSLNHSQELKDSEYRVLVTVAQQIVQSKTYGLDYLGARLNIPNFTRLKCHNHSNVQMRRQFHGLLCCKY
jgi:hypothetical protein